MWFQDYTLRKSDLIGSLMDTFQINDFSFISLSSFVCLKKKKGISFMIQAEMYQNETVVLVSPNQVNNKKINKY